MSEEQAAQVTVLVPKHATLVSVAINNTDVVIVFSLLKPHFGVGGLVPGGTLEAVSTVSLTPLAAKQLLRQLGAALNDFEIAAGGKIPDFGDFQTHFSKE